MQHRILLEEKLRNKIALITGASKGVGRVIAETLGSYNMKIGLLARSEELLMQAADKVNSLGSETLALKVDLSNQDDLKHAVFEFREKFGIPDFLINCAGIGMRGFWTDFSLESELKIMAVNYAAPILLIRLLLPDMLRVNKGHIININAIGGMYAAPYQGAYCASKAALFSYSLSLGYELKNTNVKISSIFPGPIDTDFLKAPNFESFRNSKDVVLPAVIVKAVLSVMDKPKETVFIGPSWKFLAVKVANFCPEFSRKIIEKKNKLPIRQDII